MAVILLLPRRGLEPEPRPRGRLESPAELAVSTQEWRASMYALRCTEAGMLKAGAMYSTRGGQSTDEFLQGAVLQLWLSKYGCVCGGRWHMHYSWFAALCFYIIQRRTAGKGWRTEQNRDVSSHKLFNKSHWYILKGTQVNFRLHLMPRLTSCLWSQIFFNLLEKAREVFISTSKHGKQHLVPNQEMPVYSPI